MGNAKNNHRRLSTNPELIFIDEPTASLDPLLANKVSKAAQERKSEGINFIFVTYETSFLKEFADYVLFMKNLKKIVLCYLLYLLQQSIDKHYFACYTLNRKNTKENCNG